MERSTLGGTVAIFERSWGGCGTGIHLVKLSRCVLVYAEIGHGPTLATRGALHAHISLENGSRCIGGDEAVAIGVAWAAF